MQTSASPHGAGALKTAVHKSPAKKATRWIAHGITLYVSLVFLDSLRFKFTNAPKTQIIFGDLDQWAGSLGAPGLFAQTGLFNQYVIGGAELVASAVLLGTMLAPRFRFLQPLGALLSIAIMSGAISFHLFTPLGVNVDNDGGALFFAACGVWVGSVVLLILRKTEVVELLRRLRTFLAPAK
jgi:FtsH-binding integral membrane protein